MEIDHDCTGNCKLPHHGNVISAALTKHDIEETKLIRYLVLTCKNYSKISDSNVSKNKQLKQLINFNKNNKIAILGSNGFNDCFF